MAFEHMEQVRPLAVNDADLKFAIEAKEISMAAINNILFIFKNVLPQK